MIVGTNMRVVLFHNPEAGDGGPSRNDLEALLRDAGSSVRYCSTKLWDFPGRLAEPADIFDLHGSLTLRVDDELFDATRGAVSVRMQEDSMRVLVPSSVPRPG
jgi:hypothetical protein